ncbi:MAG TPA: hypothetical protein VMC06_08920 [Opitutaceae bacterium]|nr:hypothetical protein [Opitutaceae bacterium]
MKTWPILLLLCLSLVANGLLWRRVGGLQRDVAALPPPRSFPLGEMMGYLQRYTDKLWYAGEAGNWDLAKFYHDEIAETADDIAAAHVVDKGVEVSHQLIVVLPPALDAVGQAVTARDPKLFRSRYEGMIAACNACHQIARHPFVQVAVPAGPPDHWNQRFAAP